MGQFRSVELIGLQLAGPRLTLRPWHPGDAGFVERRAKAEREQGTGLACAVVETDGGRLVGSAELRLPAAGRPWPDIDYWIAPDAHGNGYAAEATRVLTDWAFAQGVSRLELRMDVRNVASARTALAAGYRFDGVRRAALSSPDGRHDLATFGRLASDTGDPIRPALPPLPAGGLSDGTVGLRVVDSGDVVALLQQETDPLTIATGFTGVPPSLFDLQRGAARGGLDWLVGLGASFAIVDVASGRFAGALRIRTSGPPHIGGIGYALHPDFRGRGFTGRALRLVADWAFTEAGFARLELGAKTLNVASQRAALAGGFSPDGTMAARLRNPDGTFSDEARFALANPRYRRQ